MSERPVFTPETLRETLQHLKDFDVLHRVHVLRPGYIELWPAKEESKADAAIRRARQER